MSPLSAFDRDQLIQKLSSEHFDLLVIGGGITGAGIALDGASRGMQVAMVEKQDFAAGTSSRSTKLIHGGLRYLKNLEFGLVREVGRERAIAHCNAPHLVVPEKMLLPLVKGGTFGKRATSFGLWLYDFLAGVNSDERRKMLSKKQTEKEEPLLRKNILKGGGLYTEYRTDDARLTIEVVKTAAKYGALPINYCKAKDFIYESDKISGAICYDSIEKKEFQIKAKIVVNAGGPWVDKVRQTDAVSKTASVLKKRLHLTKGVHIVIPKEKFPINHSVYFDVEDGRMIFAIPRGKTTYIGTTDTDYSGSLENPEVTKADAEYLLKAVNEMFPETNLQLEDIVSSWAGLRPLIHEEGKSPSELSRKDEVFISDSGLISIAGGKLTGYRLMAKRVVDLVNKKLDQSHGRCKTKNIKISGAEFSNSEEVDNYIQTVAKNLALHGLGRYEAEHLVRNYGKQSDKILKQFLELQDNDAAARLAKAELWFCLHHEAVYHLTDFFIRRTGRLLFDIGSVEKLLRPLLTEITKYFNWNENRREQEQTEIKNTLSNAKRFL